MYICTTYPMKRISAESCFRLIFALAIVSAPLPFGLVEPVWTCTAAAVLSVIAAAALGLVAIRGNAIQDRTLGVTVVIAAALLLISIGILQILPLPERVVRTLSPESAEIWRRAANIATLQGVPPPAAHISVDLDATRFALAHVAAVFASFLAAALLIRSRGQRAFLAVAVVAGATLQSLFAFVQFADPDPVNTIWGWRNAAIVDRVSGTFVNPNHFAHYIALAIPMVVYLLLHLWKRHRDRGDSADRMRRFIEKDLLSFSLVALAGLSFAAALLLAKSRGALLSLVAAGAVAIVLHRVTLESPRRRRRRDPVRWVVASVAAVAFLFGASILVDRLRGEEFDRMLSADDGNVAFRGRMKGIEASMAIVRKFPIFGSGLGSFDSLSMMHGDRGGVLGHAHNDYLEILATAGAPVFAGLLLAMFFFWRSIHRELSSPEQNSSRDQRRFLIAAIAVLLIAQIHSTFDFNFFILANPITAAAILGATAALPREKVREG